MRGAGPWRQEGALGSAGRGPARSPPGLSSPRRQPQWLPALQSHHERPSYQFLRDVPSPRRAPGCIWREGGAGRWAEGEGEEAGTRPWGGTHIAAHPSRQGPAPTCLPGLPASFLAGWVGLALPQFLTADGAGLPPELAPGEVRTPALCWLTGTGPSTFACGYPGRTLLVSSDRATALPLRPRWPRLSTACVASVLGSPVEHRPPA